MLLPNITFNADSTTAHQTEQMVALVNKYDRRFGWFFQIQVENVECGSVDLFFTHDMLCGNRCECFMGYCFCRFSTVKYTQTRYHLDVMPPPPHSLEQRTLATKWTRSSCDKQSSEELLVRRQRKENWTESTDELLIMHYGPLSR